MWVVFLIEYETTFSLFKLLLAEDDTLTPPQWSQISRCQTAVGDSKGGTRTQHSRTARSCSYRFRPRCRLRC